MAEIKNWWSTVDCIPADSEVIDRDANSPTPVPENFTGIVKFETDHVSYFVNGSPKFDLHMEDDDWWKKQAQGYFENDPSLLKKENESEGLNIPPDYTGAALVEENRVILYKEGNPVKWISRQYIDDALYSGIKHVVIIGIVNPSSDKLCLTNEEDFIIPDDQE